MQGGGATFVLPPAGDEVLRVFSPRANPDRPLIQADDEGTLQGNSCCWRVCTHVLPTLGMATVLACFGLVALWFAPKTAPAFFGSAGSVVLTHIVVSVIDYCNGRLLNPVKEGIWSLHKRTCQLLPWIGLAIAALVCLASTIAGIAVGALFGIFHTFVLIRRTAQINQAIAAEGS